MLTKNLLYSKYKEIYIFIDFNVNFVVAVTFAKGDHLCVDSLENMQWWMFVLTMHN